MDSILRTSSTFNIWTANSSIDVALQISRNFLQYFGLDSEIFVSEKDAVPSASSVGNDILVVEGGHVPDSKLESFPIRIGQTSVTLRSADGAIKLFNFRPGIGAIFVRPLPEERLELVVWGADRNGLRQAARLVPMLTGVGQPDFIILDDSARWKGASGVLAAGFFDYQWNISRGSFIT